MSGTITRCLLALIALPIAAAHAGSPPLVVHEWGTFTSFQDAAGRTIAGINVDDEPVPYFVHRLRDFQTFQVTSLPARWSQGAPRCHPDVTLRLETPVVYFYPPAGWQSAPFDVRATFNGGWLTEFFPAAATEGMNVQKVIDAGTSGSLLWRQVRLDPGAAALMPETSSHVWLAPRQVDAAVVTAPDARQAEKYLFYRGVGHMDAPIVVRQSDSGFDFSLHPQSRLAAMPRLWVVEVAAQGRVRYQTVEPAGQKSRTHSFESAGSGAKNGLESLRLELATALTGAGLYQKEAAAMLETWRLSYFESAGLRVFFLLPQSWTDAQLPLSISTPTDTTRVMVGRVELVTAQQRETLRKLVEQPGLQFPKPLYYEDSAVLQAHRRGGKTHADLYEAAGREVPESLRLYESLGRFRDALLAHEWQKADEPRRNRLASVMQSYSACVAPLGKPALSDPTLTTAK